MRPTPLRPLSAPRARRGRAVSAAMAIGLVSGLAGCSSQQPPRIPSQGGPAWVQLDSPHFTLRTNVPADVARLTLEDFEIDHGLLASVLPHPEAAPGQKIGIVLFSRP